MDIALIEKAVGLARTDGEWKLNAGTWTGALAVTVDGNGWSVQIDSGVPGTVTARAVTEGSANDADHVVDGTTDGWNLLLSSPPPAGFTDFWGATSMGAFTVAPAPESSQRHLALRRFGELLRHAHNGTDPAPRTPQNHSRHGAHDAAVGRYIHLDLGGVDHRVYYETAGEGIGLVCQHTAGADGRQWRHLMEDERITSKFRVVVYDLPSHGKSLPPESTAWWAEPYVLTKQSAMELPVALSAALSLDRPVFIGSSVGGMLALDLARYHADDFRAVISLEGGLKADLPEGATDASFQNPDPAEHAATMMMIMSPTAPEASRQETRLHYAQGAPGVFGGDINYYALDHDLMDEADRIDTSRCAVHLLTGEYDFFTVPWTELAGKRIAGATCTIMRGLGHFPMSEDHAQLMEYVLPILDGIAA